MIPELNPKFIHYHYADMQTKPTESSLFPGENFLVRSPLFYHCNHAFITNSLDQEQNLETCQCLFFLKCPWEIWAQKVTIGSGAPTKQVQAAWEPLESYPDSKVNVANMGPTWGP